MKTVADFYAEGIELFNAGRFFECHEAWEQAWIRSRGEEKLFYQGLIQAAVAILHAQRGNREGAHSLHAKARAKLTPLPAWYRGVAVDELLNSLALFLRAIEDGAHHLPPPPLLRLVPPDRTSRT